MKPERKPMKPIRGWIVMYSKTGPANSDSNPPQFTLEIYSTHKRAKDEKVACDADYAIPVEIRERPKPRRVTAKGRKK